MNNNCITTYTGRHIDPLHPDPDMICIEDIAGEKSAGSDLSEISWEPIKRKRRTIIKRNR